MYTLKDLKEREKVQSHTFVHFSEGTPYSILGWSDYKKFNEKMNEALLSINNKYGVKIYLQEHEDIHFRNSFYWIYSFSVSDHDVLTCINNELKNTINDIIIIFSEKLGSLCIFNNQDYNFNNHMHPELASYYYHMIFSFDVYLKPEHPPKIKSYSKENIDLSLFYEDLPVNEFKKIVRDYFDKGCRSEHMSYLSVIDGFHSSKYEENKTLKEECFPLIQYLDERKITDDARIKLGLKKDNFDAKIILKSDCDNNDCNNFVIIELTSAIPDYDHLLLSITSQASINGYLPLKNMHEFKNQFDMFPDKIVEAINKKHNKEYDDERILIVNMPMEYSYQNEDYIINEIINEVKERVTQGKGKFTEIVLNHKKLFRIF